jgi:hypothetical protein
MPANISRFQAARDDPRDHGVEQSQQTPTRNLKEGKIIPDPCAREKAQNSSNRRRPTSGTTYDAISDDQLLLVGDRGVKHVIHQFTGSWMQGKRQSCCPAVHGL